MKFRLLIPLMLATVALATTACGGSQPAPAATALPTTAATAVPPTATPAPAVSTTAAATSAPGGGALSSGAIGSALQKSEGATAYRVEMQMSGSGAFGTTGETPAAGETPAPGVSGNFDLLKLSGEVNGNDSHFLMGGLIAAFLGMDPTKGVEVTTVGDKSYIHGPIPLLGANQDAWYVTPAQTASAVKPPLTASSFLQSLTTSGLSPSDVQKSGTESLDNQSCDVYAADKSALQRAFEDVNKQQGGQNQSNEVIDNGDLRFWVCGDGYLHQVRMSVDGHDKTNAAQKGSFLLLMHIWDINNSSISIQAPANAQPLQVPSFFNLGTPTP